MQNIEADWGTHVAPSGRRSGRSKMGVWPTSHYRVGYRHKNTGEVARFRCMSREGALEVAMQLVFDGEREVQIEDEAGQLWSLNSLPDR